MLSRTADSLYWLSRYVERAEYLARILDAAYRLTSLPAAYGGRSTEWQSAVESAGCAISFKQAHGEADEKKVVEFLAFSPDNPSSIRSCFEAARANGRGVRTALTQEMWSTINDAWLRLKTFNPSQMDPEDVSRFLEWVKSVSLMFDGSAYRTMLRNDAYDFSRVGLFVERADNTARILDVKYHVLLPPTERVGGSLDYFHWVSILRAVSAQTAYHWVYKESLKPWLVADLLILNAEMPRSLTSCYLNLARHLGNIAKAYGKEGESQLLTRAILDGLQAQTIDDIFQSGLHEFVTAFLIQNNVMGAAVAKQYLS